MTTKPTPTEDRYPPVPDDLILEQLEAFRVLSNPIRIRILHQLRQARSVAEVAEALAVPPTRLYYHFKALTEVGVIEVLETRKKGTQLEKIYRICGRMIRPGPGIWKSVEDPYEFADVAAAVVLDPARAELVESIAQNAAQGFDLGTVRGTLGRTIATIPADRIKEFADRLHEFLTDLDAAESVDGVPVSFTYVLLPTDPADVLEPEGKNP